MPILRADMTLCISLSGRPSNLGTRFHNFLYDELGLAFVYKAFQPTDIGQAIAGVRGLGIRGCSVSMPFKEAVIPLVDELEQSAAVIGSVNTIVNDDGRLTASNTDYEAIRDLIAEHRIDPARPVVLQGAGGMAKAVAAAFHDAGFGDLTVVARDPERGSRLAGAYGYRWADAAPAVPGAVLVNATPLGMAGADADALAFPADRVAEAGLVFDVVAFPAETPLIRLAQGRGIPTIDGAAVIARQAAYQFARYTGVTPTADQVLRAAAFSREPSGS